jgi:UDP:flavonoid glycosyltransferase YjiC (YdhE family)
MRVLFTCVGSYGHLFPLVPLARAVADAGHAVGFATAASLADSVKAAGFDMQPTGMSQEDRSRGVDELGLNIEQLPPSERRPTQFVAHFATVAAPANLAGLLSTATHWRPDVIVHEMAELAAPIVAANLGTPSVNHGFGRMVPLSILAKAGRVVEPLWRDAGLEPQPYGGSFRDLFVDPCPPSFQLEAPPIERVAPIRPVGFDRAVDEPPPDWIANLPDRPTIYVTLGTVFNRPDVFRTILDGLAGHEVNVIVTTGRGIDAAALGPQPDNVRIESYVPQSAILGRCTAVISHGGSGSMLATLAHGLPMVLVPLGADQFDNAQSATAAGTAIALMPGQLTPDAINDAVATILAGSSYRVAAERLRDEIAAMPPPASVVGVVESLVHATA